jgi:putative transposase
MRLTSHVRFGEGGTGDPAMGDRPLLYYEAGQWYVIFSCEVEQPAPLPPVESEVGIDLGVTHFAALSDGTFIESPRFFRKAQADLKRKQRHLSRCKRGSHRRERARKAVAKAHRKIRHQRQDFHHQRNISAYAHTDLAGLRA